MKVTLSAVPVHISITVEVSPWILHAIDKIRRSFVWTGSDSAPGGWCTVAWSWVTRPTMLGGLGVIDLVTMGLCCLSDVGAPTGCSDTSSGAAEHVLFALI
jgi:hypothetical protein